MWRENDAAPPLISPVGRAVTAHHVLISAWKYASRCRLRTRSPSKRNGKLAECTNGFVLVGCDYTTAQMDLHTIFLILPGTRSLQGTAPRMGRTASIWHTASAEAGWIRKASRRILKCDKSSLFQSMPKTSRVLVVPSSTGMPDAPCYWINFLIL